MPKYVRRNRPVERSAVNATIEYFERHHCLVQPVFGENDIGKDAYVDLTDERRVTGVVIAIQVKGGQQIRRGPERGVPFTADDADFFCSSTIPVVGIAHDEEDGTLWWTNLSEYCRARRDVGNTGGGFAPALTQLTNESLPEFKYEMSIFTTLGGTGNLLDLVNESPEQQSAAVSDCFALGRRDPRAMLLLRRVVTSLHPGAILTGLSALAYLTPHPDIGWSSRNWVIGPVKDRLRRELRWSAEELRLLLSIVDDDADMWGRGVVGENVTMLLLEDPQLSEKLIAAVRDRALTFKTRYRALVYLIYLTKDDDVARSVLEDELNASPDLTADGSVQQLARQVNDFGWVDVF